MSETVGGELDRRNAMWEQLLERGGPLNVEPSLVRELGLYAGQRGVWMNKAETDGLSPGGGPVAVGLLHTGEIYADDLAADGVIYHFPMTQLPGRDVSEVESMKAASALSLPVFVITTADESARLRDVHKGWIEEWDDTTQWVLVEFHEAPLEPPAPDEIEVYPFELTASPSVGTAQVLTRPGQARFKFQVFQRYGPACVVCDLRIPELLDAAHIRDKRHDGSDDPRNGLVLCALHHRAFDRGLFCVEPGTLLVHVRDLEVDLTRLRISRESIAHLVRQPHDEAISWRWNRWTTDLTE